MFKSVDFRDFNHTNESELMIGLSDQMYAYIFPNNFDKALKHYSICIKTVTRRHAPKKAKKLNIFHHVLGLIMNMYYYDQKEGKLRHCL